MQKAEWKLPSCVSMKNIYQMFGGIPVYIALPQKRSTNQSEFIVILWKLPS